MNPRGRRIAVPLPDLRGPEHLAFSHGFWSTVEKRGADECWPCTCPRYWKGRQHPQGYGVTTFNGRRVYVHRLAYAAAHGAVPAGAFVTHQCPGGGFPPCCNPKHLSLGDQRSNMADMARWERGTQRWSAADIDEMRRLRVAGVPVVTLATTYGTTKQQICVLLSCRRGTRRYTTTTEPPVPPHPRLADQINLDLALALIGMGHSVGSVATWLRVSTPSLRYSVRRTRALRHPFPIDSADLAVLLEIQATLFLPRQISGVTGPLPSLTLARPGVAQAVGGLLHHRRTRLTPAQTAELRARYQTGESLGALSEAFHICREHASRLARTHVGAP